ncbi:hypothetical protein [Kosmotoga pacifica]|uniref:Uncharacterized protein n=1 Tax=Kosmotoga pacifica TaxID=1330330 RepID=A0A0G2ZDS2_9BACT|nr:hypothetical protein [Kosmotoga pacifica]AKI97714.1 hypothetical protein IX53_07685 [Kosmotoga pacifica]
MKVLVILSVVVFLVFSITIIAHGFGFFGWDSMWNGRDTDEHNELVSQIKLTIIEVSDELPIALAEDASGTLYLLNFNAMLPYMKDFRPYEGLVLDVEGIEMNMGLERTKSLMVVSIVTDGEVLEIPEEYMLWVEKHYEEMYEHMGNWMHFPAFGMPCH